MLPGRDRLEGGRDQAEGDQQGLHILHRRESDIKKGKFILSWLTKDGSVKHTTAPNPSARNNFKTMEEALTVLKKMIFHFHCISVKI